MSRPSPNPPCKHCGGPTKKCGLNRDGRRRYLCQACRRTFLAYYLAKPSRPPCRACGGRLHLAGKRLDRQAYLCYDCGKFQIAGPSLARQHVTQSRSNLYCVACHGLMIISGVDRNKQRRYGCKPCKVTYFPFKRRRSPGMAIAAAPTVAPAVRQARQQQAAMLDVALLDLISAALPDYLPLDLREDVMQETAVAALDGEFDLSEMARMVSFYRRRINRLSANRFQFVSLSQPISNTNGLTYGDVIAG